MNCSNKCIATRNKDPNGIATSNKCIATEVWWRLGHQRDPLLLPLRECLGHHTQRAAHFAPCVL